jgi:isopentenyldiphosphate isomerase
MKITIVDENDNIVGYKDREDRNPDDIFRITAIWVIDNNKKILLQQRKLNKKINPGKWGPAVSGTVEEGETYESNAYKEMNEEIGVEGFNLVEIKKVFMSPKSGRKFVQLYKCVIPENYKLRPQEEEVEQLKWFSEKELLEFYKEKPEEFVDFMKELIDIFVNK